MEKTWKKHLPVLCAALGAGCLAGTAAVCLCLDRGGPIDRLGMAAVMLALAGLAVLSLRLEKVDRDRLLILLLPIGAALLIRALCLDYAGRDYNNFLCGWYRYFQVHGGFRAIAGKVGDYNVPYLYFLAAISYIPVPDLYLIKLLPILFDLVLAWGGLRLTRALRGSREGDNAPLAAYVLLLFLPTVVLNGAYWGQCDVVYGALALHAAACVLEGRNKTSLALMAAAFSFKLQAVFLLPLWGVLWLARRVKFRELWVFPGTCLLIILPALLLGKPLRDILSIYLDQTGNYPRLTLNAPSVFQFVPYGTESGDSTILPVLGIAAAGALVLALLGAGLWLGRRMDRRAAMAAAVVLAIGVPFFLPHMHERYFFLADILTLCWACFNVRRTPVTVMVCASSLAAYRVFLRLDFNYVFTVGGVRYGMPVEAAVMLAALVISVVVLVRELRRCARQGGDLW